MSALLITYDLNRPGQNYSDLHEAIKSLGKWWHYLDSTWIVSGTLTPSQASAKIQPTIDKNDRLLIIEVTSQASQGWLPEKAWEWIQTNV